MARSKFLQPEAKRKAGETQRKSAGGAHVNCRRRFGGNSRGKRGEKPFAETAGMTKVWARNSITEG